METEDGRRISARALASHTKFLKSHTYFIFAASFDLDKSRFKGSIIVVTILDIET